MLQRLLLRPNDLFGRTENVSVRFKNTEKMTLISTQCVFIKQILKPKCTKR